MKLKRLLYILCTTFMLTGCAHASLLSQGTKQDTWSNSGFVTVGHNMTIQNTDNQMTLLENIDVLSADGLYYATWTMGDSEPYENSEGDIVDLYDAHLYLLLGEFPSSQDAQENMNKWLTAGKSNYEILSEEEITCSGQSYSLITYNCINETNPYERGASAFGMYQDNAVCIELTCRENFEEDPRDILIHFLDNITYSSQ
ncbi:MAG: hypothetical protein K2H52_17680 [Lachnospiraceae bacterium]|nr:hypothetical protein [Lachnospiraceae bacterium]MDE6185529.1 hypothetical protein [Lachnospiraceae bacterium]